MVESTTYQHRHCHNSTQLTTVSKRLFSNISLPSTLPIQLLQSSLIMLPLVGIFGQNQQQPQQSDSVTTQAEPIQQQQLTHNNKRKAQQKQSTNFSSTFDAHNNTSDNINMSNNTIDDCADNDNASIIQSSPIPQPVRRKKPSNRMNRKKIDQAIAFSAFAVEEDHQGNHDCALDLYLAALENMLEAMPIHADQSRKDALKTKLRDFIDRTGLSEEMISELSDSSSLSNDPNIHRKNQHKSCCVDSDSFNKYHSSNYSNNDNNDNYINNINDSSNSSNNTGISDHIIQAAITGAVALKQSPIPDAISATVNYTMKKIKNIDETYGLQDKAWEISRSGINLAFEIDQQYNVHEKVGNVLFTGIAAAMKAGIAYKDSPSYKQIKKMKTDFQAAGNNNDNDIDYCTK